MQIRLCAFASVKIERCKLIMVVRLVDLQMINFSVFWQ